MFNSILVAYDGSDASERAFEVALDLARSSHATLDVISVAQFPEPATMVETSAILEAAQEHYAQSFEQLRNKAQLAGIETETRVVAGHAAEQIIHAATEDKVDLIVMGHRGKSFIQRWLLGSVSKRVVTYAPCSVLIVR